MDVFQAAVSSLLLGSDHLTGGGQDGHYLLQGLFAAGQPADFDYRAMAQEAVAFFQAESSAHPLVRAADIVAENLVFYLGYRWRDGIKFDYECGRVVAISFSGGGRWQYQTNDWVWYE